MSVRVAASGCSPRVQGLDGRAASWGGRRCNKHERLVSRRRSSPFIYQRAERIMPICFSHAEFLKSVRGMSLLLLLLHVRMAHRAPRMKRCVSRKLRNSVFRARSKLRPRLLYALLVGRSPTLGALSPRNLYQLWWASAIRRTERRHDELFHRVSACGTLQSSSQRPPMQLICWNCVQATTVR
jgi:hypothetical protein